MHGYLQPQFFREELAQLKVGAKSKLGGGFHGPFIDFLLNGAKAGVECNPLRTTLPRSASMAFILAVAAHPEDSFEVCQP